MAKEKLITFQKFNDQGAASELANLLKENNVEYLLEDTSANFDPSFAYNELAKEFRIKLKKQDFEKANRLLQQVFLKQLDTAGKDYYLYDFTDAELKI